MARICMVSVSIGRMRLWSKISGELLVAALFFVLLSPLLGVHVHDNGIVHSHSRSTSHNHSDKTIPQNEIPSLPLKLVFNKSLPLEVAHSLLFFVLFLAMFSSHAIAQPAVVRSVSVRSIRDGTLFLPSPPRRIAGQRAPPISLT